MKSMRIWKVNVIVGLLATFFPREALRADPASGGECRLYMLARADLSKVSPAALRQAAGALLDARTVASLDRFFQKYGTLHEGLDKGGAQTVWMEVDWAQGVPRVGFWIEAAPTWKAGVIREALRDLGNSFITTPVDYQDHPGKMGTGELTGFSPEDPAHVQTWVEPLAAAPAEQSIVAVMVPRENSGFDSDPKGERRKQATLAGLCEALAVGGSASVRALAPLVAESKFVTMSFGLDGTAGMTCRLQAKDESAAASIAQLATMALGDARSGGVLPQWLGQPLTREKLLLLQRILIQIEPVAHGSVVEFGIKAASIAPASPALVPIVSRVGRAIRIVESARHLRQIAFECGIFGNVHDGICPRALDDLHGTDMLEERDFADSVRHPSTCEAIGYVYVPPQDARQNSWGRGKEIVAYKANDGRPDPSGLIAYGDQWIGWGAGAPIPPLAAGTPVDDRVNADL